MASFLDLTGLSHFWSKAKSYIDSAISSAKTTVGNYTVNGKKISTNPTISKSDVGLSNVTNDAQVKRSEMGKANGVATLDENVKIPSEYLPSYVDDVLEYSGNVSGVTIQTASTVAPVSVHFDTTKKAFVAKDASAKYYSSWPEKSGIPAAENFGTPSTNGITPTVGKIYVDTATNKTYRWSGSGLAEISASLALGTTSSTAFRGDYGNTAYQHANAHGSAFASGLYKITTNSAGHVTAATAVTKTDITNLGIPGSDSNPEFQVYYGETKETLGTATTGTSRVGVPSIISSTNKSTKRSQRLSFPGFGLKKDSTGVYLELLPDAVLGILPTASTSADGLMSSEDKTKLNGLKNYTLPKATESTMGGIKLGGDNVISSTTVTEAATSVSSKIYAVQLNSAGKAVVCVPWTDTNTTYGTISTAEIDKLFS